MLSALLLAVLQLSSDPLVPQLEQVRLQVGATSIAPVADAELPWEVTTPTGTLLVTSRGYEFVQGASRIPLEFNPDRGWFLCADSEVAWFAGTDFPTQLKRVSLSTGRQLDIWNVSAVERVAASDPEAWFTDGLVEEGRLFLLFTGNLGSQVLCLDSRSGVPHWERVLPGPDPDSMPITEFQWNRFRRDLTFFGELLVARARPDLPILAFDKRTGADRWQVERIWEFQNPPASDFLSAQRPCRFAAGFSSSGEDWRLPLVEAREEFDQTHLGWMRWGLRVLAGPRPQDEPMLLVFGGTARRGGSSTGVFDEGDTSCYEIDLRGEVVDVLTLSGKPNIEASVSLGDRLVIAERSGVLTCVVKSPGLHRYPNEGNGEVNPMAILWRREFRDAPGPARFVFEPAAPSTALCRELAVMTGAWGRVDSETDRVVRLPISLVDPVTGNARVAELTVRFTGKIKTLGPEAEVDDSIVDRFHPQWLGIGRVEIGDERLRIQLRSEETSWTISFALADVLAAR